VRAGGAALPIGRRAQGVRRTSGRPKSAPPKFFVRKTSESIEQSFYGLAESELSPSLKRELVDFENFLTSRCGQKG
jgi:hypothetical protein